VPSDRLPELEIEALRQHLAVLGEVELVEGLVEFVRYLPPMLPLLIYLGEVR